VRWRSRGGRALMVFATLAVVCGALVLLSPRGRCALRIAPGFVPYEGDSRIYYVPGSEPVAARFAGLLPEAIADVEEQLSLPFRSPFRVYVCPTHEEFARRVGEPPGTPVRGIEFPRDIWVSPLAFEFFGFETGKATLAHELVHLHFGQHLGLGGRLRPLPSWFEEGVGDWIAGAGFERTSRDEAVAAYRSGERLVPDAMGRPLVPRRPPDYGLTWPVFHAQSRMFVEHLHFTREESFAVLVRSILAGTRFDVAFRDAFGRSLEDEWQGFVESIMSDSP